MKRDREICKKCRMWSRSRFYWYGYCDMDGKPCYDMEIPDGCVMKLEQQVIGQDLKDGKRRTRRSCFQES